MFDRLFAINDKEEYPDNIYTVDIQSKKKLQEQPLFHKVLYYTHKVGRFHGFV